MLRFISDFSEPLAGSAGTSSPTRARSAARCSGIHRDVRFSPDKTPYKTGGGRALPHRDARSNVHVPGFYLHLEPGEVFAGSGIWHPDSPPWRGSGLPSSPNRDAGGAPFEGRSSPPATSSAATA